MSSSPLEITAIVWGVIAAIYVALFLIRSVFGMHEEDTLYLSAGETRMAEEQRQVMKRLDKMSLYTRSAGWATLGLGVVLAGMWVYSVIKNLF